MRSVIRENGKYGERRGVDRREEREKGRRQRG